MISVFLKLLTMFNPYIAGDFTNVLFIYTKTSRLRTRIRGSRERLSFARIESTLTSNTQLSVQSIFFVIIVAKNIICENSNSLLT